MSTTLPAYGYKPAVWLGCLLPLLWLLAAAFGVAELTLGANPVRELLHFTGKTGLNLLLLTLCMTPLHHLTGRLEWLRVRRMLGLFAFSYTLLHFVVYVVLELDLDFSDIGREIIKRPFITIGLVALLMMLPLALTSTDRAMRSLGRRWQALHRLIYPIAILAVWHYYWQVKADIREPLLYAAALTLLLGWRLHRHRLRQHRQHRQHQR